MNDIDTPLPYTDEHREKLRKMLKDAFPHHARPCPGAFLPNGDFITISGRYVRGPLCKKCGGLADSQKCSACGEKQ